MNALRKSLWAAPVGALLGKGGIWAWEKPLHFCAWLIVIWLLIEWGHSK